MKTENIRLCISVTNDEGSRNVTAKAKAELAALEAENAGRGAALQRIVSWRGDMVDDVAGKPNPREIAAAALASAPSDRCGNEIRPTADEIAKMRPVVENPGEVPVPLDKLREIEWESVVRIMPTTWEHGCPACCNRKTEGHAPDCWLASLIGEEGK